MMFKFKTKLKTEIQVGDVVSIYLSASRGCWVPHTITEIDKNSGKVYGIEFHSPGADYLFDLNLMNSYMKEDRLRIGYFNGK